MHRFFQDKDGRIVIGQKPNAPIWVWAVGMVVAAVTHGRVQILAGSIASAALAVWALLEIVSGVTLFRRLLGGFVLLLIIGVALVLKYVATH